MNKKGIFKPQEASERQTTRMGGNWGKDKKSKTETASASDFSLLSISFQILCANARAPANYADTGGKMFKPQTTVSIQLERPKRSKEKNTSG